MSTSVLPGTTIAPSPSTCAGSDARSESSMSVAASCRSPSLASSRIPERICTELRVESARATTPSACASSSFAHVILSSAPTTMSVSII